MMTTTLAAVISSAAAQIRPATMPIARLAIVESAISALSSAPAANRKTVQPTKVILPYVML